MAATFYQEMGNRIERARERKGAKQAELARAMRRRGHRTISPTRMWEIEAGERRVRVSEVADFCRELNVPPWWLLGLTREEAQVLDATFEVD